MAQAVAILAIVGILWGCLWLKGWLRRGGAGDV